MCQGPTYCLIAVPIERVNELVSPAAEIVEYELSAGVFARVGRERVRLERSPWGLRSGDLTSG